MSAIATTQPAAPGIGALLREWRRRRRLSQLDLSLEAAVSARHLSFVETGRSKPSRELVLHLAERLEVPLRERNALLLAAGYAPTFGERPLEDEAMAPVREALDTLLSSHEPYPALVVDRQRNLVAANRPLHAILSEGVDPALLAPPVNVLRVTLHPDGLAPRIANFGEIAEHVLSRLRHHIAITADADLVKLHAELSGYPGVGATPATDAGERLFVPLRLRHGDGELSLITTIATFGTVLDVTISELSIESFFPADAATADALRAGIG